MSRPPPAALPPSTTDILPDLLRPGLRLVFCGSAAGRVSAAAGAYYANPGNRFWPTLVRVGLTPRRLAPSEFRCLLDYGIGLTDLAKRHVGNDADLPQAAYDTDGLRQRILACAPRWLAFTGKHPARRFHGAPVNYGAQPWMIGGTAVFVLPSPSGQARRFWDEAPWRALSRHLRE